MLSDPTTEITKETILFYLKEVAGEYRKRAGRRMPAELILIGGASVLINYGFRNMTVDIDAVIHASSSMKDAVNTVGDRFGLSNGWLNDDFKRTDSYTPKLAEYSVYYRTFSNVLTIRTVAAEYLIAMKLRSGRQYKSDLSDIAGILSEHRKKGNPITMEQIRKAVIDLYGDWDCLSKTSQDFITAVMENNRYDELYEEITKEENADKEILIQFRERYPKAVTKDNAENIIENLQKTR